MQGRRDILAKTVRDQRLKNKGDRTILKPKELNYIAATYLSQRPCTKSNSKQYALQQQQQQDLSG